MKRFSSLFVLVFACMAVTAQELPVMPAESVTVSAFIPKEWKTLYSVKADLNKDGSEDAAIVIVKDQQLMLAILVKNAKGTYTRSYAGTFNSIEYISKLGTRNNTLQVVFDLPSYPEAHIITIYCRYQNNDWMIIGYSEESYADTIEEAPANPPKGSLKDVNLVTGEVKEYALNGKKKIFKEKYKQKIVPLLALSDIDKLAVMNW